MPKYFKPFTFVALTLALIAGCSKSDTPKLGEQYQKLPTLLTQSEIKPVTEVFSLTCGHCRNLEPSIPELERLTQQKFGKVHVTFNQQAQVAALIYYAAEMQLHHTPDETFMKDLFAAVQMGKGSTLTQQRNAIEQAFISRHMASPYSFDSLQQKALSEYLDSAKQISEQANFDSVPTFVVNGKYQVLLGGHQNIEDLAKTINFLLKQP